MRSLRSISYSFLQLIRSYGSVVTLLEGEKMESRDLRYFMLVIRHLAGLIFNKITILSTGFTNSSINRQLQR